jgi:hypothetical protein
VNSKVQTGQSAATVTRAIKTDGIRARQTAEVIGGLRRALPEKSVVPRVIVADPWTG